MFWMKRGTQLNLNQVQYLLVHKPLVIVKLEHSSHNKKLIANALKRLFADPKGPRLIETLRVFLEERAIRYSLTADQVGARAFLLRQMETLY